MRKAETAIPHSVREILSRCTIEGRVVYLPEQLPRPAYELVHAVLLRLGGTWSRGARGHQFAVDPIPLLDVAIEEGRMPEENSRCFYPTPDLIATILVGQIEAPPPRSRAWRLLEPSAGAGALVHALVRRFGTRVPIDVCEIEEGHHDTLSEIASVAVVGTNFLAYEPASTRYDVIAMNPPYTAPGDRFAYLGHLAHAVELLAPGGQLVAILPQGFTFRQESLIRSWRGEVERHGGIGELPEDAFAESGTGVRTCMIHYRAER